MGRKFILKVDNMSLKYLFKKLDLNARKATLIHFGGFFHEIFPHFENSWINTSFFYHGGKTMALSMFLIFNELSCLYRGYMAIFADP